MRFLEAGVLVSVVAGAGDEFDDKGEFVLADFIVCAKIMPTVAAAIKKVRNPKAISFSLLLQVLGWNNEKDASIGPKSCFIPRLQDFRNT